MLSFKEYLLEAFDNPYPWKWITKKYGVGAKAKTKDGDELEIFFTGSKVVWELDFAINNSFDLTNRKDQFKIFATVFDVLREFVDLHPEAKKIEFNAEKDGVKDNRPKVYKKLMNKYKPKGWALMVREAPAYTYFALLK